MRTRAYRSDVVTLAGMRSEIERGVRCARQGYYVEATALFAHVREQAPEHTALMAALVAFIESHERHWQAEQALHRASQHFAMTSADQQVRLEDLQGLLARAPEEETVPAADRARSLAVGRRIPAQPPQPAADDPALPELHVTCFGRFEVWRRGMRVEPCSNRNGQVILRYLVAHPHHRETMDVLMEALWPDDPPQVARHKLHCASSALRRTLNGDVVPAKGAGYLLCENGVYQLNPAARIAIDAEAFLAGYRAGQRAGEIGAIEHYEDACRLYTGQFLPDDLYADWSHIRRELLTQAYVAMCGTLAAHYEANARPDECIKWALRILDENRCDEMAYQQLIRAHTAAGRRGEALRQYQHCENVLAEELGVRPLPETTALYDGIRRGEQIAPASLTRHARAAVADPYEGVRVARLEAAG